MIKAYYNEFDPKCAAWLRQLIKNGNITPGVVDERSITEVRPEDLVGFDRVHFFAGIGTWDYCLSQAEWGDRPIWTASLPCQPFSAAGRRLGKADDRHLLPHFLELVKECRPETIFGEQVASSEVVGSELEASFIIAVQQGEFAKANKLAKRLVAQKSFTFSSRWIDDLYAEMEAEGYAVRHSVLGAHSVGSFHIRQRLYWVANSNKQRLQGRTRAERTDQQFVGRNSMANGLRNTESERFGEAGEFSTRSEEWTSDAGSAMWLADTQNQRRESISHQQATGIFRAADEAGKCVMRSCSLCAVSGVDWIYCRDNKYRPVKPGIQPLVDGAAGGMGYSGDPGAPIDANATQEARAMRLKGYGNAIQAQTAIAFISAFMSV